MELSVIVCTHGRPEKLRNLLIALSKQEIPPNLNYELAVIDNQGTEVTKSIVEKLSKSLLLPLRYVQCTEHGLSKARNYGLRLSQGEIVLFTDDDCLPNANWISDYWELFQKNQVDAAGGPVVLARPNLVRSFFKKRIHLFWGPLGFYKLNAGPMCFAGPCSYLPIGANMAISRACIERTGKFREDLGLGAGCVGEETDYFERILSKKQIVMYSPSITVFHDTDPSRASLPFIFKWYLLKVKYLLRKRSVNNKNRFYIFIFILFITTKKLCELLCSKTEESSLISNLSDE